MTIDVNVLRERLRGFADEAGEKARVCREAGNMEGAHFETGRQAAFITALSQITRGEWDAARERDAAFAANLADEEIGEEAARLGVIGYGRGVDLGAVERLEEFARQAGGAVDMTSGAVYSDADGGL